jgi:hypothetical protein
VILHTVMPPEVVWGDAAAVTGATGGTGDTDAAGDTAEVADGLRRITLLRCSDGRLRVQRLVSTEPRDYLDRRWEPGRVWSGPEPGGRREAARAPVRGHGRRGRGGREPAQPPDHLGAP